MEDKELVDGVLKRLIRENCYDTYFNELLNRVGQVKCPDKKNNLIQLFIEEIGVVNPECLLVRHEEEDKKEGMIPSSKLKSNFNPSKSGCPKCPKKKSVP